MTLQDVHPVAIAIEKCLAEIHGTGPTFLNPPKFYRPGEPEYQGPDTRKIELVFSLAVLPSVRIWATWYAGN